MDTLFRDQKIVFANGAEGRDMTFPSASPVNYAQVLNAPADAPPIQLDAKLFLPPEPREGKLPLVIVVPGSVGVAASHLAHAETITNLGAAAFVVDPFGARQVSTTVANQTQFSFAASAFDVLAALTFVTGLPDVDARRIGAQGHSRGGSAVLTASLRRFADAALPGGPRLRAVYSVYPWCGHQFLDPDIGDVALRAVIGERDNWCSPQQAQGYVNAIRLAGGTTSFRLFADAEHSFDRPPPIEQTPDAAVAPHAPTIYIDNKGAMIHPVSGEAEPDATDRDMMVYGLKAGFGVTGASLGGKGDQPAAFREDMSAFWREHLALEQAP